MRAEIVLTVSESKRLIAKGVARLDIVRERMRKGMIVLAKGSTNAYIYEELTGQAINKRAYVTGFTAPTKGSPVREVEQLPDLVLLDGECAPELDRFTAIAKMRAGDIFIKGANALNYARGVAGITVGSPTGGTIGRALEALKAKNLCLLIPVGLEKEVPVDIEATSARLAAPGEALGMVHALWPVRGIIFTEIEALRTLCAVDALPVAAGGVFGAEGGLRLLLDGSTEAVGQALEIVENIQGESPFVS
jgi:hypothetical protein